MKGIWAICVCALFPQWFIHSSLFIPLVDWMENTRDIVNFLLYYLPPTAQASGDPGHAAELPLYLPRLPDSVAEYRRQHGFDGGEGGSRQIIGLGHSAGATALFMAAVFEPKLLHSLTVLEPIVLIPEVNDNPIFASWITGAIGRRDKWASRYVVASYKQYPRC